jgi:broad specificity phosphatase PhoE
MAKRGDLVIRPIGQMVGAIQRYGQSLYQRPPDQIRGIEQDSWYSPLQPIKPLGPPGTEPRAYQYWAGQNLWWTPRQDAEYSAADLKALAKYPLAAVCIENVKDTISRVPWEIQMRAKPGETRSDVAIRSKGDATLLLLNRFFEYPDREHNWQDWLRPLLDDLLVIDASSILLRKNFRNELAEMVVLRGEMIVRYIDENGLTPVPPNPAYAQNWWGIPLVNLTTDQLVYKPRNIAPRNTLASQLYGQCYRDGTEVLTESGWKLFQDVDIKTERIATRNLKTKAFEWQLATAKHCYDYVGDLIRFSSRSLDLEVTPQHRMVIDKLPFSLGGNKHRSGDVLVSAAELEKHCTSATGIPVTSIWHGVEVNSKRFPAIAEDRHVSRLQLDARCRELRSQGLSYSQIGAVAGVALATAHQAVVRNRQRHIHDGRVLEMSGDDYCALIGLYLAEGSCEGNYVYIAQSKNNKRISEMRALLHKINNGPVLYSNDAFIIGSKFLARHLRPLGHAGDKYIPQEIMNATSRQLQIFWHHFWLGDGDASRSRAFTSSKRLADQLQELAQKMGVYATIRKIILRDRTIIGRNGMRRTILAINSRAHYVVAVHKRGSYTKKFETRRQPYSGKVYCLTVPNSVVYVRRNGKACFAGNSPTEQVAEEIMVGISRLKFVRAYYEEGSIPGVVQVVPRGTSPERITEAMDWMNSQLAGNLAARNQWRLVQGFNEPGKEDQIIFSKEPLLAGVYDEKHIRQICFAYGTSPQRLIRMIRTEGRAAGDASTIEGTLPWVTWLKGVIDYIIQKKMGFIEYEIAMNPYAEPDPLKNAAAITMYVKSGVMTPNEARKRVGEELRPEPEADRLGIVTGTGFMPIGIPSVQAGVQIDDSGRPKPHPVTPNPDAPGAGGPMNNGNDGDHNAGRSGTPVAQEAGGGRSTGRNVGVDNGKESLDGQKTSHEELVKTIHEVIADDQIAKRHGSRIDPSMLTPESQQGIHQIEHVLGSIFTKQLTMAREETNRFFKLRKAESIRARLARSEKSVRLEDQTLEKAFREGLAPLQKAEAAVDYTYKSLFLMRHGRTALDPVHRSDGWLDFPLSDDGRVKLITAQQYLSEVPLRKIYCATLKRTKETADIVSSGSIYHPRVVEDDRAKTWNLGVLAGKKKAPNKEKVKRLMKNPDEAPEGGESRNVFIARLTAFMTDIKSEGLASGGPTLTVFSGSCLRELSMEMFDGDDGVLDLDEGGMLVLNPDENAPSGWKATLLFGHKSLEEQNLS